MKRKNNYLLGKFFLISQFLNFWICYANAQEISHVVYSSSLTSHEYCENEGPNNGAWTWSGSLLGYNKSFVRNVSKAGAFAVFLPQIIVPGVYEVLYYTLEPKYNVQKIGVEVNSLEGKSSFEFKLPQPGNTASYTAGFKSLGKFKFEAGNTGSVKIISLFDNVYTRVNVLKFQLISKDTANFKLPNFDNIRNVVKTRRLPKQKVLLPTEKTNALQIYVKPGGTGNGSCITSPLAGFTQAQAKVRALVASKKYKNKGIVVNLLGGTYSLAETLAFTANDGGKADIPVIWKAYNNEKVSITTGKKLSGNDFRKVTDYTVLNKLPFAARDKVLVADLKKLGITSVEVLDLIKNAPYLFTVGDKAQQLSRWPNQGYAHTGSLASSASRKDSGPRKKGFTYEFDNAYPFRWSKATDAWLNGFWLLDYNMDYVKMKDVDTEQMLFSGKNTTFWGSGSNARYYVCNLLEEIDAPSEFFIDVDNLKMYYYPVTDFNDKALVLATNNKSIVSFNSCSNIVFSGVTLECAGGNGLEIDKTCSNITLAGLTIRNISGAGAIIDGTNNVLRDCDIYDIGQSGVTLNGGNVNTLKAGNNLVENCSIHDVGTTGTQKVGIWFSGVGNRIANNHIYNIPQHGIIRSAEFAECIIENNILERVSFDFDDASAIYVNFPGFGFGTKIRNNLIVDCIGILRGEWGPGGNVHGIYLDNGTCGIEVTDNVVINAKRGIFSNYGRDIVIKNNILINTEEPIVFSNWGNPNSAQILPGGELDSTIKKYNTDTFRLHYPNAHTGSTMSEFPYQPRYDTIENNLATKGKFFKTTNLEVQNTEISQLFSISGGIELNSNAIIGGSSVANHKVTHPKDLFNANIISDFNAIRSTFGITQKKVVGLYTGGLRTDTIDVIINNIPEPFKLAFPENGSEYIDPRDIEFSWESGKGGIINNILVISETPDFKSIVALDNTPNSSLIQNLEYGKTYFWRVFSSPKFEYDGCWNACGAGKFSTIAFNDKLSAMIYAANAMLQQVPDLKNRKNLLTRAIDVCSKTLQQNLIDSSKIAGMAELKSQMDAFMLVVPVDKNKLVSYINEDFSLDEEGQRPLALFLRSYMPLKVNASDVNGNRTVKFEDAHNSTHFGSIVFPSQNSYLEASVDVMAADTSASFSVSLMETDKNPVNTGVASKSALKLIFQKDGWLYGDAAFTRKLLKYTPGKWYKLKVIANLQTMKYDVYVNGVIPPNGSDIEIATEIRSIYMLLFDTSDGTKKGENDKGIFYIDNVEVKAPKRQRNSFIQSISINGEPISNFDASIFQYDINLPADKAATAIISYLASPNAHIVTSADMKTNTTYITVFSGDYNSYHVYVLKGVTGITHLNKN
jgi:hypothetical protein